MRQCRKVKQRPEYRKVVDTSARCQSESAAHPSSCHSGGLQARQGATIGRPGRQSLKQAVAEAIKTIWPAASKGTTDELATLRAEARHAS